MDTCNAITHFCPDDLEQLLVLAREHYDSVGISGILLSKGDRFLHFLRGTPGAVDALEVGIGRDPRHADARVVFDELEFEHQFD
ncbi:BLUF domain-containing protein [Leucobacter musarum]|uniref:BLUF domain-containing protein n=1 Tax=Leucobacter musarum TaxID=1930747 RepID=UPI0006A7E26E